MNQHDQADRADHVGHGIAHADLLQHLVDIGLRGQAGQATAHRILRTRQGRGTGQRPGEHAGTETGLEADEPRQQQGECETGQRNDDGQRDIAQTVLAKGTEKRGAGLDADGKDKQRKAEACHSLG